MAELIKNLWLKTVSEETWQRYLRRQGVKIGERCEIDRSVEFGSEPWLIEIGSHVRITQGVKLITHDGGLWVCREMGLVEPTADYLGKICIGSNVHIGWNALIMPGVTIGNNALIAAGAVVTADVPDGSVAAGVPARVIETIEEYAAKKRPLCAPTKGMSAEEKRQYYEKIFQR